MVRPRSLSAPAVLAWPLLLWLACPLAAQQGFVRTGDPGTRESSVGPPRSTGTIALQLLGGVGGAWVGGLLPYLLIDRIDAGSRRVKGDAGYSPNANTAYAIGSWLGSSLAVYGIGELIDPGRGSFLGGIVGAGVASIPLLLGRDEPYLVYVGFVVAAPLQAIGGTIGVGL